MRLIRLFVDQPLAPGQRARLSGSAAAHATRVLRLGPGAAVTTFNGDGHDYPGKIVALRGGEVEIEVESVSAARAESKLAITLVQGVARGDRMDLVIQKAAELGVTAIQPVLTSRSVVKLTESTTARKQAHWRGVAIAACEQSGRARIPVIGEPMTLPNWLAQAPTPGVQRIQLAIDASQPLATLARGVNACELLIGPEGGLDDSEQDVAESVGFVRALLGPRVLRSETAAIAALVVLQATAGDL